MATPPEKQARTLCVMSFSDLEDFHDPAAAMRTIDDEGPFAFGKGVAHLDPLHEDPMAFFTLVDREDVVGPGIPRFLHQKVGGDHP